MQIKKLVNNKTLWDSFCEEIDLRIKFCHKQLEQRNESSELYRLQGEIKALRSLKQLRDKINGEKTETF
jgi:RNAse (barnase) inhibitor barstar